MKMENKRHDIKPATRLYFVTEYYFSRKLKEIALMNSQGDDVISLAIGSPDLPPSEATIEKLCEVARKSDTHGYQPTCGIYELRQAIADFYQKVYGVELNPEKEIQPLIGSKEGILHVTLAFVNPDDEVLVPDPGYPTYTSLSRILGAKVVKYNLKPENNWQPDFGELKDLATEKTRLIWTNYPNMPTGADASVKTYENLVKFAFDHNITVVNDNPYSLILNKNPLSILQIPEAKGRCIEFNSMSKSHNMPGWRVGLCASNPEFISWILKIKSNIDSGTFKAIQLAAAEAFSNSAEWHEEANIKVYQKRRKYAEEIMKVLGCSFNPDQKGMFLWGKIPEKYKDCESLTEAILKTAKVFITPGLIFGHNGDRYIRISLCSSEERIKEALERIVANKNSI